MSDERQPNSFGGLNGARVVGDQFVKPVTQTGSPHAEEATGKIFTALGLPHLGVKAVTLPDYDGIETPHAISPYQPLTNFYRLTHEDRRKFEPHLKDRNRAANLLLGEWLANAGDRHAGNYAVHPVEGVLSIDHGESLHPGTFNWPNYEQYPETRFPAGESLTHPDNTKGWANNPATTALLSYHQRFGGLPGPYAHTAIGVDPDIARHWLTQEPELLHQAYKGTLGLPEAERHLAVAAMRMRINHLRKLLSARGDKPVTVEDMGNLTRSVREEAAARVHTEPADHVQ